MSIELATISPDNPEGVPVYLVAITKDGVSTYYYGTAVDVSQLVNPWWGSHFPMVYKATGRDKAIHLIDRRVYLMRPDSGSEIWVSEAPHYMLFLSKNGNRFKRLPDADAFSGLSYTDVDLL